VCFTGTSKIEMAARVLIRLPECQTKRPQFGAGRDLGPPEHREGGSQCSAARRSHPDCRPLFNFEHCPNFKLRVSELGQHPLVRPRNRPISVHGGALESAASLHSGRACPHDGARQPHTQGIMSAIDDYAEREPATASTSGISRTRRADASFSEWSFQRYAATASSTGTSATYRRCPACSPTIRRP
jgi:hypothetical protein